ncbi:TetR/AcrR family transcriptional regulator [Foetidibacter luteolus]|uniref:TetR/AcrR family transcriptional regulator n=1 Tax=Foetidibacter luteolus TaxID=2608880 RepID=UPI00129A47E8|nr:TetR/AcrR family transcriptional regulator [Foetidibacter luteolus]
MARSKEFNEEEVLKKAMNLFWDKGYNGTSMQDLIDGLGISRSSLYDTFGDKRQLYIKALELYQQQYGGQLCTLIKESATAKEAVRELLNLVVGDLLGDKQRKGCFSVNAGVELATHDEEISGMLCQNEQQLEKVFLKVIKDGQKSGELTTSADPQALTRFLMNTVKGLQVSVKSTANRNYFNDIINTTLLVLY